MGEGWPPINIRQEMLAEAVEIIRMLWSGGLKSYYGNYFTVEEARLYTLPEHLPRIYIAASGEHSATLAGQLGDGFISTSPQKQLIETFSRAGGKNKPTYGQITVCVAKTEEEGIKTAMKWWSSSAVPGQLSQELKLPPFFQQAVTLVTEKQIKESIICGNDPQKYLEKIKAFAQAGFDHIYIHQVGPYQESFFRFYEKEILPQLSTIKVASQSGNGKPDKTHHVSISM